MTFYNEARVSQPGSTILNEWRAQREAGRVQAAAQVPTGDITKGTEAYGWLTGGLVGPGRPISEQSAMSTSTAYACVALIGGALAGMSIGEYRREGETKVSARSGLWSLLNVEMHPLWSAPVGWEFVAQSLLLEGDGLLRIHRTSSRSSEVKWLEPRHPKSVDVRKINDRLVYFNWREDGGYDVVDQDDMLHIPGPGFNGLRGMSQIRHVLRQPVSLSHAMDEQSESMMTDGLRPDLALKRAEGKKLDADDVDTLRQQWRERYSGAKNSTAPVVLPVGMSIERISMSLQDAQLVEMRRLTIEDVCRVFGVPPWMVGQTEKVSAWGTGLESMGTGFVKYTLQRHLTKIETEINRKLNRGGDRFVEYDTSSLQRGDFKTRMEGYRIALGRAGEPGWLTVNEIRQMENWAPEIGGDKLNEGKGSAPKPNPATAE